MTIAFITPEYPHPKVNHAAGIGTSIKNLAVHLVKNGIHVIVFLYHQKSNEVILDSGVEIHLIKTKYYKVLGWYLYRKHLQNYIKNVIVTKGIDIIEAPDWTGITAFMKFSIPIVIRLHGSDAYFCHLEGRKQKLKHYFFEKNALKRSNKIISVSAFTASLTKKIFNLKCNITIIHNGINVNDFIPTNTEINHGQLLYFGTIIRKKGVLELAEIFNLVIEKNDKATLLLIGKDVQDVFENVSTLKLFNKQLTEKAKQQVTYIPEVQYQKIKAYIAKAHIVVLPSFAEAFPMTWLETMSMEKALVASNIGWAKEIMINGEMGYNIDPKNHKEFSDRIVTLIEDKKKYKALGIAGRKHVKTNFSVDVITQKNINFYKNIINK